MELVIAPRGILQINGAMITHRNFSGRGDQYNREGDRNFSLIIPTREMADDLVAQGWNVKILDSRDDGSDPFMFLKVKVKFNDRGPSVWLKSGTAVNQLDEESIGMLDDIQIMNVDLDIRPYDWTLATGATGRTAYLQGMDVEQTLARFAARYRND